MCLRLDPGGPCASAPRRLKRLRLCSESGGQHPELFLQLERWHRLLRPGAPLLPRCLRVLHPQPLQAQGELPAGLQQRRVSSYSLREGSRRIPPGRIRTVCARAE